MLLVLALNAFAADVTLKEISVEGATRFVVSDAGVAALTPDAVHVLGRDLSAVRQLKVKGAATARVAGDTVLVVTSDGKFVPYTGTKAGTPIPLSGAKDAVLATISADGAHVAWRTLDQSNAPLHLFAVDGGEKWNSPVGGASKVPPAFSPDNGWIAVPEAGSYLGVFDAKSGAETKLLKTDGGVPTDVQFSPDGTTLSIATNIGAVTLWDTKTWKKRTLSKGDLESRALAWQSPDRVWQGLADGTLRAWDTHSGMIAGSLASSGFVEQASFVDGGLIVRADAAKKVGGGVAAAPVKDSVKALAKTRLDQLVIGAGGVVVARKTSSDDFGGGAVEQLKVWLPGADSPLSKTLSNFGATDMALSADGEQLTLVGSRKITTIQLDGFTEVWKASASELGDKYGPLVVGPSGVAVAVQSANTAAALWSSTGESQGTLPGQSGLAEALHWGPVIGTGHADATVRLWEGTTVSKTLELEPAVLKDGRPNAIQYLVVEPDGAHVIVAHGEIALSRLNVESGEPVWTKGARVGALVPLGTDRFLAMEPEGLKVRSFETGEQVQILPDSGAVARMAASADGKWVAGASWGGQIWVWEL